MRNTLRSLFCGIICFLVMIAFSLPAHSQECVWDEDMGAGINAFFQSIVNDYSKCRVKSSLRRVVIKTDQTITEPIVLKNDKYIGVPGSEVLHIKGSGSKRPKLILADVFYEKHKNKPALTSEDGFPFKTFISFLSLGNTPSEAIHIKSDNAVLTSLILSNSANLSDASLGGVVIDGATNTHMQGIHFKEQTKTPIYIEPTSQNTYATVNQYTNLDPNIPLIFFGHDYDLKINLKEVKSTDNNKKISLKFDSCTGLEAGSYDVAIYNVESSDGKVSYIPEAINTMDKSACTVDLNAGDLKNDILLIYSKKLNDDAMDTQHVSSIYKICVSDIPNIGSCGKKYNCSNGLCVAKENGCKKDEDCSDDKRCTGGKCLDKEASDKCVTDSDCSDQKACVAGKCIEPAAECNVDSDCSDGLKCNTTTSKCISADTSCSEGQVFDETTKSCVPETTEPATGGGGCSLITPTL